MVVAKKTIGAFTLCSLFLFWNEILTILEILGKNLAAGFHLG